MINTQPFDLSRFIIFTGKASKNGYEKDNKESSRKENSHKKSGGKENSC